MGPRPARLLVTVIITTALAACTPRGDQDPELRPDLAPAAASSPTEATQCPGDPIAQTRAPDLRPEYDTADHWLAKFDADAQARELLGAEDHKALAQAVAALPGGFRDPIDPKVADASLVDRELDERMTWLRERVAQGKYVEGQTREGDTALGTLGSAQARITEARAHTDGPHGDAGTLHLLTREAPLWCVPSTQGLFTEPFDPDFDRNQCSSLHLGELVRAIASTRDGAWTYVEAGHSVGWLETSQGAGPLSDAMTPDALRARAEAPSLTLLADHGQLRAGSSFPLADPSDDALDDRTILVPSVGGSAHRETLPASLPVHRGPLPFSRRHLFTQAFSQLDQPYGWGGRGGHRDCSRYLKDLFAQFGVVLPRNSGVQAKLGRSSEDVSGLDEQAKRQAIHAAHQDGVVLLYMPGHIMLYLGEDRGRDYAISALSEYLEPCAGGSDTVNKLDRVGVTTLEVGRGSERRAFIERITRVAVF